MDRVCAFYAAREESKTGLETMIAADAKAMEKFPELASFGKRFGQALRESDADAETIRWALEATGVSGVTITPDTTEDDLVDAMSKSRRHAITHINIYHLMVSYKSLYPNSLQLSSMPRHTVPLSCSNVP